MLYSEFESDGNTGAYCSYRDPCKSLWSVNWNLSNSTAIFPSNLNYMKMSTLIIFQIFVPWLFLENQLTKNEVHTALSGSFQLVSHCETGSIRGAPWSTGIMMGTYPKFHVLSRRVPHFELNACYLYVNRSTRLYRHSYSNIKHDVIIWFDSECVRWCFDSPGWEGFLEYWIWIISYR